MLFLSHADNKGHLKAGKGHLARKIAITIYSTSVYSQTEIGLPEKAS